MAGGGVGSDVPVRGRDVPVDYSIVKVSGLGFGLESNFAKFVHNSIKKSKFDSKSDKLDC